MMRRPAMLVLTLALAALPVAAFAQTPAAAPGQPGWSPAGNNCFVWNQNPTKGESATWSGPCEGGHVTGKGTLIWQEGDHMQRYDGEMRDGKLEGHGIYSFTGDGRYEGEFKDDQFDGTGTLLEGGDRYDGQWRGGKKNGKGVLITSGGNRYEGDFKDDVLEGEGSFTMANGTRYTGHISHGYPNGEGTLVDPTGTYSGQWVEGCFNDGKRKASFGVDPASCK